MIFFDKENDDDTNMKCTLPKINKHTNKKQPTVNANTIF